MTRSVESSQTAAKGCQKSADGVWYYVTVGDAVVVGLMWMVTGNVGCYYPHRVLMRAGHGVRKGEV
jgi:hypothetical protein